MGPCLYVIEERTENKLHISPQDISYDCDSVLPTVIDPEVLRSQFGRPISPLFDSLPKLRTGPLPSQIEVAIVGGGLHGTMIGAWLRKYSSLQFAILDGMSTLANGFFESAERIGQRVMRSPYTHQLAPDGALQLTDFARLVYKSLSSIERRQLELAFKGERSIVPLDIFRAHLSFTACTLALQANSFQCKVKGLETEGGSWKITTDRGKISANRVILACGRRRRRTPGVWERAISRPGSRVYWVFGHRPAVSPHQVIAVVGSGLSAASVILDHLMKGGRVIWLIRRRDITYKCADVAHRFFRREGQAEFDALPKSAQLEVLSSERRGSVMPEYHNFFVAAESDGRLTICRGVVADDLAIGPTFTTVRLSDSRQVKADQIILATGLEAQDKLLPKSVERDSDGLPLLDDSLGVLGHPGLHISGVLASLKLGPAAANIEGARFALERLSSVLSPHRNTIGGFSGTAKVL